MHGTYSTVMVWRVGQAWDLQYSDGVESWAYMGPIV